MELRDYQKQMIASAEAAYASGADSALLVAPCGAGKTVTFAGLVHSILHTKPDLRVLFLINRVRIVLQLERELARWGLANIGVACGSLGRRELGGQFTVASYLSVMHIMPPIPYHLVVFDEYHRFHPLLTNPDHPLAHWWRALKVVNPRARRACFTATPFTASSGIISDITCELTMREMLERKMLVPVVSFGSRLAHKTKGLRSTNGDYTQSALDRLVDDKSLMSEQVADALARLDKGCRRSVVWQCINIEHVELVAALLRDADELVAVCHSKQDDYEQTEELAEFEAGKRRHLVFVSIVSEAYDCPRIDAVVLLRPTKSPVSYVQTVGRAMRPFAGKQVAHLLDYGQVVRSCGPLDFPFVRQRQATLDVHGISPVDIDRALDGELPVVECSVCGRLQFVLVTAESRCLECGDLLTAQLKEKRYSKLEKTARRYDSLYSSIAVVPVSSMSVKWKITADKAHSVTITYNDKYIESYQVIAWQPGRFDKYRAGSMAKLSKRLRELGLEGKTLTDMALSQDFKFRPEFLIASSLDVLETSGSVSLDDTRGEGTR